MELEPTRIMVGVNQSSIKGYPHPSISSRRAFDWTLQKIVRSNTSGFKLLFLHVQVPDEDGGILFLGVNDGEEHQKLGTVCSSLVWKSSETLDLKVATKAPLASYIVMISSGFDDMDSIYASPRDFREMKHRDKIRGLHLLEYFVGRCHEIGVPCEAWIKKGDPKEVICQEVVRVRPDLLVLGSRGLGPFQRVFVGTVSEFCAKHAECPVVTIKRKADETPSDPVDD